MRDEVLCDTGEPLHTDRIETTELQQVEDG